MIAEHTEPEELREWTLMFYFASDNPLAPSIVSQLKALKAAGFHAGANVVAHFDPYTRDTPSHVFEVNVFEKLRRHPEQSSVGFDAQDPSVRNLVLDKVWEEGDPAGAKVRDQIEKILMAHKWAVRDGHRKMRVLPKEDFDGRQERSPEKSLGAFLKFCAEQYPARHYMLFILGHGVVVGNDVFLFDSNPGEESDADDGGPAAGVTVTPGNGNGASTTPGAGEGDTRKRRPRNSLTLIELAGVLSTFKKSIGEGKFELLAFHSCSMSGAEVAYELQDTAHYMLASQGPAFVGSWPYRQILLRVFKGIDDAGPRTMTDAEVREMIREIFTYVIKNSYDFQLAGYSFDLALCDLTRAGDLKKPIDDLTRALADGLAGQADLAEDAPDAALAREMILLAHWDAQSFWQENYTDLYDFCLRLRRRCALVKKALGGPGAALDAIVAACEAVMEALKKGSKGDDDRLLVRAEFVGAEYQYSHGLSIYFPWAQPADRFFEKTYREYRFIRETAWKRFLDEYFKKTLRETRAEEEREERAAEENAKPEREQPSGVMQGRKVEVLEQEALELLQIIGTRVFNTGGQLAKNGIDDRTGPPGKVGSDDPTGDDCGCPTFKNHPSSTGRKREGTEDKQVMSPTFAESYSIS